MLTPLRSLAAPLTREGRHKERPWLPSPPEALLAAGQPVRKTAQLLGGISDAAQGPFVLEPLPVALLFRLPGLCLRPPGLLPLPGLRFGLGLPLLGPALVLLCLVARQGTVGLLGLAHRLVHRPPFLVGP